MDTKGAGEKGLAPGIVSQSGVYWKHVGQVLQTMTLDAMMVVIRAMPVEERKRLISLIVDTLTEAETPAPRTQSILDFEGAGAELWAGVDAQEYVNKLRDEWDKSP